MPKPAKTPFDVKLSREERENLAIWLSTELDNALNVRNDQEIAYFHTLYEQGRTRGPKNSPWPDAADLTSPIGTEKVDALRSRIVRTIFSEQIWAVEGWGEAASKAPFVEEFLNWQAEVSGVQGVFSRAVHLSLIEPRGVIEVYEDVIRRPVRRQIRATLQLAEDGTALVGPDLQPVFQQGPDGKYLEAPEDGQTDPMTGQPLPPTPSADLAVDDYELVCHGPRVRAIPTRDFLQLPAHAREQSEVWGYAKRFWRTLDSLKERVEQDIYDAAAVKAIGTEDEKASAESLSGEPMPVATKEGGLAEKELFEVTFLKELDKTGLRWFVATIHKDQREILRLKYDEIGKPRYFSLVPFPKPDSLEGYSFIGNKLITVIEENTAWRNMLADRAAVQVQAPMLKLQGALWDPDESPIGPKSVLTVRSMNEVAPLQLPDYTGPARERILDTERQAEKLAGMSDIASGTNPNEDRTLGETQLISANSEVRIEEVIRNIQEPLEEIAQVLMAMWKRALGEMPDGMELPPSVLQGLETRGANVANAMPNKRLTVAMLEGTYRFKPKGSVETADKPRQQRMFNEGLQVLANLAGASPMIAAIIQQPKVAKALLEKWVYLYSVSDKQAFLGQDAMNLLVTQMQTPGMPGMPGAPPPPPGAPPDATTGAPQ